MRPTPRLWTIVAILLSLLGPVVDLACAEEVDPVLLDACPGYNATSVKLDGATLTAKLVLAGAPCNVFGDDIKVLDLTVVYETGRPLSQGGMIAFLTNTLPTPFHSSTLPQKHASMSR